MLDGQKQIKLSELYGRIIDGNIDYADAMLIAKVLKTVALSDTRIPEVVFNAVEYIDLEEKEDRMSF